MERKVFGIGLPRCGGQTLQAALSYLVGCCAHSPGGNWDLFDNHQAFAEVYVHPITLMERYGKQTCVFVLNARDEESWLRSCESVYDRSDGWNHPLWRHPLESFSLYGAHYLETRIEHASTISIVESPRWDELCSILGVPVPDIPFPRIDRVKEGAAHA